MNSGVGPRLTEKVVTHFIDIISPSVIFEYLYTILMSGSSRSYVLRRYITSKITTFENV